MTSTNEDKIEAAQGCFYDMMEKNIAYSDSRFIRTPFSSGWFLNLTNNNENPAICWHIDERWKVQKVK